MRICSSSLYDLPNYCNFSGLISAFVSPSPFLPCTTVKLILFPFWNLFHHCHLSWRNSKSLSDQPLGGNMFTPPHTSSQSYMHLLLRDPEREREREWGHLTTSEHRWVNVVSLGRSAVLRALRQHLEEKRTLLTDRQHICAHRVNVDFVTSISRRFLWFFKA